MIYIKQAEKQDAGKLTNIKVRALEKELKMYFGKVYSLEFLYEMMEDEFWLMKQFKVYKIMLNNEIIGRVMLDNYEKGIMRIEDFAIEPEYQGRGYGLQVLRMVEELYPHIKKWLLSSLAKNRGNQMLYQKAGYVEIARDDVEVKYEKVMGRRGALRIIK